MHHPSAAVTTPIRVCVSDRSVCGLVFLARADDVGMAEMEIGSEPHRHDFNVGICLVRAPAHFARPRWRARRSLVGLRPEPPSLNSWRVLETQLTWEAAGYTDLPFS